MKKICHSIQINASREKVWNTMLEDVTYREWTVPFGSGSYYEGDWQEGSILKFLGAPEEGSDHAGGMYSRIKESRPYEFVSIEHLGIIDGEGNVDTTSDEVMKWVPSFENYTFTETNGGTELKVEVDVDESYQEMFDEMWPKALELLKSISERTV